MDMPGGPGGPGAPGGPENGMPPFMMGETPHNLVLNFTNTSVTGIISAATQHYREGISFLEETIREELSHVTQKPAPAVNNGVLVKLDAGSTWTVSGTSFLTRLEITSSAVIRAEDGKKLIMTLDGAQTQPLPGIYKGQIKLEVI